MSRRLVNVTLDNLSDLPSPCRQCVYWELDPVSGERARDSGDGELEKEAWVSDTLLEWGSCGQLIYVDGVPAGYALYAPPAYVPRSIAFPTSPVAADAVLLMTARLLPEFRGGGLGRMLLQGVARDLTRRGMKAIEAFGRVPGNAPEQRGWAAAPRPYRDPEVADYGCLLPAEYLRAVGFKTVRHHPRTPRLRLDVKSTVSWREDVEYAIDRLLGSLQVPVLSR
ncbi:MAG: GNAT family N-acetyltransferase [Jatrophihabitans sp.]|uniref:GNAT family N-acetyltransferase n=1 Tax=Jatrophihabitans sp. TaxID=1932789 RepID=UPI003F807FC0